MTTKNRKGTLFVFSGPSGAGKGTLLSRLFSELDDLGYSVSCTTRAPREGEQDGIDYHFISDEDFKRHIDSCDFLEWANVHSHRYGTLRSDVQKALDQGRDIILEIDVQGALQVKEKMPEAVTIFVAPPSLQILEQRFRGRGTEDEQELQLRLKNARQEMEQQERYDFTVVNDDLEVAASQLKKYVQLHRQEL